MAQDYRMDYWDAYYRGQTVHTGASHWHMDPWGYLGRDAGTEHQTVANSSSASIISGDQQVGVAFVGASLIFAHRRVNIKKVGTN